MAESILFDLTGSIIIKLGYIACQEVALVWRVNDELDELKVTLSDIQAVLHDAEQRQSKSHEIKAWVSKLKDVLYEIDDLIDESFYETLRRQVLAKDRRNRKQVRILLSKFISNWKIGHKIDEIRKRLKVINDNKNQFSFSSQPVVIDTRERHDDGLSRRRETGSYIPEQEVIGRNNDREAVIDLLLNNTTEDIAVVSIVGMGGLGKTALAQSIYNHNRMSSNQFQLKLWVCVSEEFDLKIIIQKIIESATRQKPESSLQMDTLENELRSQIDGKKYLLVMDDVWSEKKGEWLRLKRLLVGGAKGSRILITTRSEQVAKTFDTTFLHSLQILDSCNSWLLFQKMTGLEALDKQGDLENSNLIQIGKEIVSRLKGVPLVIRTIGGLLKDNKSKKFWLSFRDKELYQVLEQGQDDLKEMRLILELSYKYLPANLKQCFLYCALFPKDYKIQKDELILLWRAQGFIQKNVNNNNLIDIGDDYFKELLSRSFFQEVTINERGDIEACKMHDLMHDIACSIPDNECVHGRIENVNDKRILHFSWNEYCGEALLKTLSTVTKLRTFFMLYNAHVFEWDLEKFHCYLRLRTLGLRFLGENPDAKYFEFIGKLRHLRYLSIIDLDITNLPDSITKLYNLETFILQKTRSLENLPSDMKNLINLKHLDLSDNDDLKFLPNSITQLCKLESLILKGCTKLKGLPEDIQKWINLKQLDLSNIKDLEFLPDSITRLNNLETLFLSRCVKLRELPEDIKKLINLKHLDLCDCCSLTHIPKGLGELIDLQTMNRFVLSKNKGGELNELDGLIKLRGTLCIENLQFCTNVDCQTNAKFLQLKSGLQELFLSWRESYDDPTIGELDDGIYESALDCLQPHSNLKEITIEGYGGVKLCNWVSSNSLGCLVTIRLVGCKRLQHLPRLDQLPYLKQLYLISLPNIEYIFDNNNDDSISSSTFFPSLEALEILHMPKLERWWKRTTSKESPTIFPCISYISISACPLHILKFLHAPNLKVLIIGEVEDKLDVVPWETFENLTLLYLFYLGKLEYLPECWQHCMTPLQHLNLIGCKNLKSLPEWIGNLTSLTNLSIHECEKLTFLPEGIRYINGLQCLTIGGCPILIERCEKDTGEDWPKIAHVPNLDLQSE